MDRYNSNGKGKARRAGNELSALETALGYPISARALSTKLRRAGQTPLERCDTSGLQTKLNRLGNTLN